MLKEKLQNNENVIFQILNNCLSNNKIPHLFLLQGQDNEFIKDVAILISQSIIEGNNTFACEKCNTCHRIRNNTYLDLVMIDKKEELIKKEDISKLMERFSLKAQEGKHKIFIINHFENSTAKVNNMLLKFIEEPTENTYGILITGENGKILDTILSRCFKLSFKTKVNNEEYFQSLGYDQKTSYLINKLGIKSFQDHQAQVFTQAKDLAFNSVLLLNKHQDLVFMVFKELYQHDKKDYFPLLCHYYLELLIIIIMSSINEHLEFKELKSIVDNINISNILNHINQAINDIKANLDKKMVIDHLLYKIKKDGYKYE